MPISYIFRSDPLQDPLQVLRVLPLLGLLVVGCSFATPAPEKPARPSDAPEDAVFGALNQWAHCTPITDNELRWRCQIWDTNGSLTAQGEFKTAEFPTPELWRKFAKYDGGHIRLDDGVHLFPDGWIAHPSAGFKVAYINGREVTGDKIPIAEE